MWLAEVKAKAKGQSQILFSKDSLLFKNLSRLLAPTNRRALVLWALELAEETAAQLEAKYPDHRPRDAVGQACSVVHTVGHALGYPMYELTAIVLEQGLDNCKESVEARTMQYLEKLMSQQEPNLSANWAAFLK